MANTAGFCTQAKVDMLNGLHAFGTSVIRAATTKDSFKAALYLASASRSPADTTYTATGEVSGANYVAGGVAVTNATVPSAAGGTVAYWTPSGSLVYTNVTLQTSFDTMMLYNDTSATKLAVAIFSFGPQTITGTFTLSMPTNDGTSGLIRIA